MIPFRASLAAGLSALAALAPAPAHADPGYYVVTAYDHEGVTTIDQRYWTVKQRNQPVVVWPEIGIGHGVTSRWYTELFASYIGSSQMATRLSTLNWQNEVLLTQGQYPVDVALHASLIRDEAPGHPHALELGPALQTDFGRTQLNVNAFFERAWGPGTSSETQLKYQWQLRYRWHPLLNVGLQGFGEVGEWNHWSPRAQQSHRAGPALFGTLRLGEKQSLLYQAAWLTGSTYGQRGSMFSSRVQLAF